MPNRELPTGTVTFLFTDIEGSTGLLHELGDAYADELAEHRHVLREAFARHGGVEVDTQGDAFFVAFARASDALAAAAAAQAALDGPVRVRMGVHTGEPVVTDEGYVGMDVHRAARIAAAGHGGQILVSQSTRDLVDPYGLQDLGEHRLKDLTAPERIYQVGEREFPRLKTLYQTNLPIPTTPFVGRDAEVADVVTLLTDAGVRLITLTGPGGTGKTRLALQAGGAAAEEFPDGIWWVPLAPVSEPSFVLPGLARALQLRDDRQAPALDLVSAALTAMRTLVVFDNFEHVMDAANELGRLLELCPQTKLLVTSRERLRLAAEHEFGVPPLIEQDAVELFVARAAAVNAAFPSDPRLEEVCRRLDNLPLAIELAAARAKLFTPAQLLERLPHSLDLFKGPRDADPRQATLRATIEWSYDLLSSAERSLFARLAVFRGSCTIDAVEEVCDADPETVASLLDKSLMRRRIGRDGAARFWLLETIREFCTERLTELGDRERLEERHAAFFAVLVSRSHDATRERDPTTIAVLDEELENVRATLEHAFEHQQWKRLGMMLYAFWFYWLAYGLGSEAASWAHRYFESPARDLPPLDRFAADLAVGEIVRFTGDQELAAEMKRALVELAGANPEFELHDGRKLDIWAGALLADLVYYELNQGRIQAARHYADHALATRRAQGAPGGIAHALDALAAVAFAEGDYTRARNLTTESSSLWRDNGYPVEAAAAELDRAEAESMSHDLETARRTIVDALPCVRSSGDALMKHQAATVTAVLASGYGEALLAAQALGAAARSLEESGLIQADSGFTDRGQEEVVCSLRHRLGAREFDETFEGCRASDVDPFEIIDEILDRVSVN
jgi:predicted ATPase